MTSRRSYAWPTIAVLVALVAVMIALPQNMKQWAPSFLRNIELHYGLDLVGGTQLDFRISEREMQEQIAQLRAEIAQMEQEEASAERIGAARSQLLAIEEQQRNIVEAIRTVLERRINALGVSEAIITPSYIGSEKHLLVECPGVVNTQECIDIVGKTIKLEFKEEFTEPTEEYETEVRDRVENTLKRITQSGETLAVVGQDMSSELGLAYADERPYFKDELPEGLESLWTLRPSDGVKQLDGTIEIPQQDESGQVSLSEIPGVFLAEVTQPRAQTGRVIMDADEAFAYIAEREEGVRYETRENVALEDASDPVVRALQEMNVNTMQVVKEDGLSSLVALRSREDGREEMAASHILIAFAGALSAEEEVTRTQEEAWEFAQEVKRRLDSGESFEALARTVSDGPSGAEGGSLGTFGRGTMVPAFETVAFALPQGAISDPVETQFGYHIIRADSALSVTPDRATYEMLIIRGENAAERADALAAEIGEGRVLREEEFATVRLLFFSLVPTGWKDTSLDGKHFRSATVTLDPTTNLPIVQITFDAEGGRIFQELTKRNVGKRIAIFVGGQLISAPTVQAEIAGGVAVITGSSTFEEAKKLAQDLNTGAIPAPIYLAGQRTIEATLGAEALRTSVKASLIGIAILMLYMIVVYRLLGLIASIALIAYAVLFLALLKLPLFLFSGQFIVLTLAGMAGVILSIGMAVDANVLIFERIKEELRKGKLLSTAVETGFQRAWPSIRDGNVSTFITCAILFLVGTSIVRGFAATLGMGVLVSMFSAIVVTRWLVRKIAKTPLGNNLSLFGVRRSVPPQETGE